MAKYRLTARAKADLDEIGTYTAEEWGVDQALRYIDSLEDCFKMLAEQPELGSSAAEIVPGIRRHIHRSHTVFYKLEQGNILIVRILHKNRDVSRHI